MTIPNWSMLPGLINIIASVQNIMPRGLSDTVSTPMKGLKSVRAIHDSGQSAIGWQVPILLPA